LLMKKWIFVYSMKFLEGSRVIVNHQIGMRFKSQNYLYYYFFGSIYYIFEETFKFHCYLDVIQLNKLFVLSKIVLLKQSRFSNDSFTYIKFHS
jgi:hypothetical protein